MGRGSVIPAGGTPRRFAFDGGMHPTHRAAGEHAGDGCVWCGRRESASPGRRVTPRAGHDCCCRCRSGPGRGAGLDSRSGCPARSLDATDLGVYLSSCKWKCTGENFASCLDKFQRSRGFGMSGWACSDPRLTASIPHQPLRAPPHGAGCGRGRGASAHLCMDPWPRQSQTRCWRRLVALIFCRNMGSVVRLTQGTTASA